MSEKKLKILLPIIGVLAFISYTTMFTVNEIQQAIILQFGDPKRVIQKAKAGQTIFNAEVFFGNEESNPIKTVSTVISNKRRAKVHNNKNVSAVMVWPIKIAFYSNIEEKTEPDYEISLDLDERGVVYSYKVDYGDFEVKAVLKDFRIIEKKICNK